MMSGVAAVDMEDGALPNVLPVLRVTNSPLDHHFAGLVTCIAFDDADPTRGLLGNQNSALLTQ